LEKLMETQPGLSMIHGMLGDLYREKGDFSRAETEFKTALGIDPELGLLHHSLADLYLQQGIKLDEAMESARKAVQLNPASNFIATLARIYYKKGMYSDAEAEIKRAISMEPENENYNTLLEEIQKKR
jgi:tetratricopeptide (TPR) repeat protein